MRQIAIDQAHPGPSAETAYLFRHALLRDAAYQLQLPGDRARLHALAFDIIEAVHGGRAPAPPDIHDPESRAAPHSTDVVAAELAEHAQYAVTEQGTPLIPGAQAHYLQRFAHLCAAAFRLEAASRAWMTLADLFEDADRCEALRRGADALYKTGQGKAALPVAERAVALTRKMRDRHAEGRALAACAVIRREMGEIDEAETGLQDALAAFRESGDRREEGIALGDLAVVYQNTGQLERAEAAFRQAYDIHKEVGNRRSEGVALGNLAIIERDRGHDAEAERLYMQSLEIQREFGEKRLIGMTLSNLATVYRATKRFDLAEQTFQDALKNLREAGDRRFEGTALTNLAVLYQATDRSELAERTFLDALALHRELGNRRFEGVTLGNIATIQRITGRLELAEQNCLAAIAIHREVKHPRFEGINLCDYALCLLALGRAAEAAGVWKQGAAILESRGHAGDVRSKQAAMREACAQVRVTPFDES